MAPLDTGSRDISSALQRLVPGDNVRAAKPIDAVGGVEPRWVVEPASAYEMAKVLGLANEAGLHVVMRGGGTKLDWGNSPHNVDIVLSTRRINRVVEHAFGDMTATGQAGCTVAEFNRHLSAHQQRLAVDPLWPECATIGGILATNDSGALRATFGGLRDCLIGITVALADGTLAKSGGKVVKNVAGYDLPKLYTGSFGTLGAIAEATFRLYACPKISRQVRFIAEGVDGFGDMLASINSISALATCVQIEARSDAPPALVVGVEGLPQAIDAKIERIAQAAVDAGAIRETVQGDFSSSGEALFADADSCVSRISVLPAEWPSVVKAIQAIATPAGLQWRIVGQAMGVGLLGLYGANNQRMPDAIVSLREYLAKSSGSLVNLRCPPDVKNRIDAWPKPDAAFPLMQRIKDQFDRNAILSPGRFIGGI